VRHLAALLVAAALHVAAAPSGTAVGLPAGFHRVDRGPAGGTVWEGVIRDPRLPWFHRPSAVYLPPGFSRSRRYPVFYLLHGFPGSASSYVVALDIARVADRGIRAGALPPFVGVIPVAGRRHARNEEWGGRWEWYVVHVVMPWADAHLPLSPLRTQHAIGGLSAGGYGGLAIGLRHPRLFGTLESWSGYARPPRDGPFAHASVRRLASVDASLLLRRELPLLRRLGTRFYLSVGRQDVHDIGDTLAIARELRRLDLPHRLVVRHGGHGGRFWKAQFPAALRYALRG
jgi:enterochelin esterase-like enzyme